MLDFTVLIAKYAPPLSTASAPARAERLGQVVMRPLPQKSNNPGVDPGLVGRDRRADHYRSQIGRGGSGFDLWTPEEGSSASFCYGGNEHAPYARKFEIRSRTKSLADAIVACDPLEEFASALAE
jgi:hypothetical protein